MQQVIDSRPAFNPPLDQMSSGVRTPLLWALLSIAGQALSLLAIDAGTRIHYQHYFPLPLIHPAVLAGLALQTIAVMAGLFGHRKAIRGWIAKKLGVWQFLLIGVFLSIGAVAPSRDLPQYGRELLFGALLQAINLGLIVLVGLTLPAAVAGRISRILDRPGDALPRLAAVWVFVAAALLSWASYQWHPHVEDELVYLLHGRYLAAGHLTLQAPAVPKAFEMYLMEVENGRWFPSPPPGWPLVLAPGILLGVPWLVNPFLAALNVLLSYRLLSRLYSPSTARLSIILLSLSPWYLFLSMSLMTHIATMTCLLIAALAVERMRSGGASWWGWAAGAALGFSSLIRPLEGFLLAILFGLWSIGFGGKRIPLRGLAALVLGTVAVGAAVFPYNRHLSGKASVFPIVAYTDKHFGKNSNAYGFGPDRGQGWPLDPFPGHGPRDAAVNSLLNTFSLNTDLFGWAAGSLFFAAFFVVKRRLARADWVLLTLAGTVFFAHIFYWYSGGPDFGARYWFLMLLPLAALTARGVESAGPGARAVALLLCMSATLTYIPWRAADKYCHYLNMRPDVRNLAQERRFGRSVVLVRGERFPDYASAAAYNPLDVQANAPIYVWDADPAVRRQILDVYSDRPVWILDGPSRTNGAFRVAAGPISHDEALR